MSNQPAIKEFDFYLRAIFEHALDGIITVNQKGIIELVNTAAAKLFGYQVNELVGKSIHTLMNEPFKNEKIDGHRKVKGKRKDGSIFSFMLGVTEIIVKDRMMYAGFIHDAGRQKTAEKEKKEVEDALIESQNLYSTIARNFPYGTISVFDKNLRYVFIDGKELFELGIDGQLLIGTKFTDRLAPEIATTAEMQLKKVFEGEVVNFELQFRDQFYILNAVPLPDARGEIKQILMVERNITQKKKADEEMQKNLMRERELNELKSRFVSMASHEFRTPLSTILSSISLLERYKETKDEEKYSKHINRIKVSVHNLTSILNDFLSLDKLEEGKIHFSPSVFTIHHLIEEIIEEFQLLTKPGQQLQYNHRGDKQEVFLDPQIIRNILVNLLSNAIKYSPENKEIKVSSCTDKNRLLLKVIDQGIGIPERDKAHMFSRFFRGHNVTNIQGTGLGLNIVKKYVDLLNGEIDYLSKENEGTTFILKFPLKLKKDNYEEDSFN